VLRDGADRRSTRPDTWADANLRKEQVWSLFGL